MRKYFCSVVKNPIPSPPIKPGLLGKFIGHAAELRDIAKLNKVTLKTALYYHRAEWYKTTNSKTYELNIYGRRTIVACDQNVYKEVLVTKQYSFTNAPNFKKVFGYFFPTSILVAEDELWERTRKILQSSINKQSLEHFPVIMCGTIERLFSIHDINQISTLDLCSNVSFVSFNTLMYGSDPFETKSAELLKACISLQYIVAKRSMNPFHFLWKLPTPQNLRADKDKKIIKNFALSFIEKCKEQIKTKEITEKKHLSLIDLLVIASEKGDEGSLTLDELIDQVSSLFFVAFDTTTSTLMIILNYLARYPEKQSKLRDEILKKFPNGMSDIKKATIDDIESVIYNNYFIDEVNRLHGLSPFLGRTSIEDVNIQGYEIKKGTYFICDSNTVGKDPENWGGQKDLDKFRPERWNEFKPKIIDTGLPFGFGRRICSGKKIALIEMKIFFIIILSQYNITLRNPNEKMEFDAAIGVTLKRGTGNIQFSKL
jgi:cytochrome P450